MRRPSCIWSTVQKPTLTDLVVSLFSITGVRHSPPSRTYCQQETSGEQADRASSCVVAKQRVMLQEKCFEKFASQAEPAMLEVTTQPATDVDLTRISDMMVKTGCNEIRPVCTHSAEGGRYDVITFLKRHADPSWYFDLGWLWADGHAFKLP